MAQSGIRTVWVKKEFEEIKKGDTFLMFESTGEPVQTDEGRREFSATCDSYKDELGQDKVWVDYLGELIPNKDLIEDTLKEVRMARSLIKEATKQHEEMLKENMQLKSQFATMLEIAADTGGEFCPGSCFGLINLFGDEGVDCDHDCEGCWNFAKTEWLKENSMAVKGIKA